MSKWFVSNKTLKLELGDGNYIEYKDEISYQDYAQCMEGLDIKGGQFKPTEMIKMATPLMEKSIVGWNLKEDDGSPVTFDVKLIDKFKMDLLMKVLTHLMDHYQSEKKSEPSSNQ